MPAQFVSVKQSEAEFQNYLWGRNEKNGGRAIPVKTYSLGTPEETVTFEIRPLNEIAKPGAFVFLASFIKLKSYILILLPLFFVLVKNSVQHRFFDPVSVLFAALASVFLFAGLNVRNDVLDHVSGFDRVNLDSSPKPIRAGWITAALAARISWVLIGIAAVLALPALLVERPLVWVVLIGAGLFLLGRFAKKNSYKQQHFGELVLFLLVGPALASGYQVALGAGVDTEILAFGVLWGTAVLYLIQVNNFAHIMTSSQAGIQNTMTKLGFDLSQKFLQAAWVGFLFLWGLFHYFYLNLNGGAVATLILLMGSWPLLNKISNIKSPMGSGLQKVRQAAYKAFLLMVLLFVIETAWALGMDGF